MLHRGHQAEEIAYHYLRTQGLKLIARNYRCYQGEIDLIMQDKNDIVFVEVRHRSRQDYGSAIESVNKKKQFPHPNCRFDIIGIHSMTDNSKTEWIKNAFWVES
jgi:putative endonuclease